MDGNSKYYISQAKMDIEKAMLKIASVEGFIEKDYALLDNQESPEADTMMDNLATLKVIRDTLAEFNPLLVEMVL